MLITQEMDRKMLMDSKLTYIFWTHAVHTTVHIQNKLMVRNNNGNNLYIKKFSKDMHNEFEISLFGELSFFLGLQIHQRKQ
jgi:hypothetical protein